MNKKMLFAGIMFFAVLLSLSYTPTMAAQPSGLEQTVAILGNCDKWFGLCFNTIVANATYYLLVFALWIFTLVGKLFDLAFLMVLNPDMYNIGAIYNGWVVARDTANLFFIFILLTIAIATILRIETYGAKALLPKLIIVALFINFSFLITQYVIFSANIFAQFFLPGAATGTVTNSFSEKFVRGFQPNSMLASFELKGIEESLQTDKQLAEIGEKIFKIKEGAPSAYEGFLIIIKPTPEQQQELTRLQTEQQRLKALDKTQVLYDALLKFVISAVGATIFIGIAIFVLATAIVLLLGRIVILWFLMILSPIAFLFLVLPGLRDQAMKWWRTLLDQAFWPVAFFFLFWVTIEMIGSDAVKKITEADVKLDRAFISNFRLVFYYILLSIMLLLSLAVAKSMGGAGAAATLKFAKGAQKYALGFAGGIGKYGLRVGRRYGGGAAEELATKEEYKWMRRIPFATRALSAFTGAARADVEEAKKKYDKYSNAELKNLVGQVGTPREERTAITEILASRHDLKPEGRLNAGIIKESSRFNKQRGRAREASQIDNLLYQYAEGAAEMAQAMSVVKPNVIAEFPSAYFKDPNDPQNTTAIAAMNAMWDKFNISHIQKIIESRTPEETQNFMQSAINRAGGSRDALDIAVQLENAGNRTLAEQLITPGPHQTLLRGHINF